LKVEHTTALTATRVQATADITTAKDTLKEQRDALDGLKSSLQGMAKLAASHEATERNSADNAKQAADAHAAALATHNASIQTALEAQKSGQCDAELTTELQEAGSVASADAARQSEILHMQQVGLSNAIQKQKKRQC